MPMHHFLLVYSYAEGKLLSQEEFADGDRAAAAYTAAEREHAEQSDELEIVLVGSDSIQTIMKTHGHYFDRSAEPLSALEEQLKQLLADA